MSKTTKQMFGKYQILRRIATGGMAEILQAKTESIGGFQRSFAIKRVLTHLSANKEYVAMLVDEAKIAGLLSHANIVQILDLGQIDKVWFIAMEYVAGADLGRVLKSAQRKGLVLPVPHSVFIAIELLKGLEYAHKRKVMKDGKAVPLNIVHRDISPPNILLSFQGEVKLTDFGIASASHKALNTEVGIVKGRYDYMSPEQAQGLSDLDCRSDLFSLGVVLYEMLGGQHPFRMGTELGTLDRIRLGKYVPLSELNPGVPAVLGHVVDQALKTDRAERYASAKVLRQALDEFFHDSGFLFTHSTLASYMKGLLPEGAGDTVLAAASDSVRTKVKKGEWDVKPEDEKGGQKSAPNKLQMTGLDAALPDPSEWDDDLDTVVGKMPDLGTPKPVVRMTRSFDEQETLIRPGPILNIPADPSLLDLDMVPEPKGLTPVPVPRRATRPVETPLPRPPVVKPAPVRERAREAVVSTPSSSSSPSSKGGKTRETVRTSSGLWPLVSMFTLLLGLFLGAAIATAVVGIFL